MDGSEGGEVTSGGLHGAQTAARGWGHCFRPMLGSSTGCGHSLSFPGYCIASLTGSLSSLSLSVSDSQDFDLPPTPVSSSTFSVTHSHCHGSGVSTFSPFMLSDSRNPSGDHPQHLCSLPLVPQTPPFFSHRNPLEPSDPRCPSYSDGPSDLARIPPPVIRSPASPPGPLPSPMSSDMSPSLDPIPSCSVSAPASWP